MHKCLYMTNQMIEFHYFLVTFFFKKKNSSMLSAMLLIPFLLRSALTSHLLNASTLKLIGVTELSFIAYTLIGIRFASLHL